jgi:hypothetical protein
MCEATYKSKRLKLCEDEESNEVMTNRQLTLIIQELLLKQEKMQETIDEMQRWVQQKKHKIKVTKWLDSKIKPPLTFEYFMQSLPVSEDDLQVMFRESFATTALNILKKNLKSATVQQRSENPIVCFIEKVSVFYIFRRRDLEGDETPFYWDKMTSDDFVHIIRTIHFKLLNRLCAWRDENEDKLERDDKMMQSYNKTVIRLMGADLTADGTTTITQLKAPLYQHLKGDLKNMVDIQFEE